MIFVLWVDIRRLPCCANWHISRWTRPLCVLLLSENEAEVNPAATFEEFSQVFPPQCLRIHTDQLAIATESLQLNMRKLRWNWFENQWANDKCRLNGQAAAFSSCASRFEFGSCPSSACGVEVLPLKLRLAEGTESCDWRQRAENG